VPAVLNAKVRKRLGDSWFHLAFALKLGTEKRWSLRETYTDLGLNTTTWYDTPFVQLGLLSPDYVTPKLFVEAVESGIDGLDYNVPGDGTYLDDTLRKNRERAISRTPRSVCYAFFKDLTWPRETRSGTPLSGADTKRPRDDASDDDDSSYDTDDDDTSDNDDDTSDNDDDTSDDDEEDTSDDDEDDEDDDVDELLLGLPKKRRKYKPNEKQACLALLLRAGGDKLVALQAIHRTAGYERVTHANLIRWQKSTAKKNMGRGVNVGFERAVVGHLILTVLEKVDVAGVGNEVEKARVVANVTYSYEIIKLAADTTRKENPWASDAKLLKLKFSNKWVKGFLRRTTLRRRRNTSSVKAVPSPAVVAARMKEIQAVIEKGPVGGQPVGQSQKYEKIDIINADETASHYALKPVDQYVPKGTKRGSSPAFDDKARFTSMLYGDGEGTMLAIFNIIKCTVKSADLRSSTVISALHKKEGFREEDGWALKMWDRELTLKDKTLHYYRPYIVHTDGTVITTQHKAWMDSVGMCMWADLVVGPWAAVSGRKKLLVWDSCGPHTVAAVKAIFALWGIAVEALPLNMTDVLQVMDLVVNGPLKAHMRRFRCTELFNYFQSWKLTWAVELAKPAGTRVMPAFLPPKPKLIDGLNTLTSVSKNVFSTPTFKKGVASAFVKVGLIKAPSGKFVEYTSHSRGDMLLCLAPADSVKAEEFAVVDLEAADDLDADVGLEAAEESDDESNGGLNAAEESDD